MSWYDSLVEYALKNTRVDGPGAAVWYKLRGIDIGNPFCPNPGYRDYVKRLDKLEKRKQELLEELNGLEPVYVDGKKPDFNEITMELKSIRTQKASIKELSDKIAETIKSLGVSEEDIAKVQAELGIKP